MTRTTAREIAIHFCFELGFSNDSAKALLDQMLTREMFASIAQVEPLYAEFPDQNQEAYIRKVVSGVGEHGFELDGYIEKYAVGWKFERIPRTAAAIMRVAMYEIMYMPEIPNGVAINEAVNIAKGYEDPDVVSFLNGILGSFVRKELGEN
jgi:N utilization substance protein B